MLSGQYYNAFDKDLLRDRERANSLCKKLNDIQDGSQLERVKILKNLFQTDKDCWIESPFRCDYGYNIQRGGSCIILPGVKIGNNTTIGAGSVVSKDIPENVVAVGNPCRVIKEIK